MKIYIIPEYTLSVISIGKSCVSTETINLLLENISYQDNVLDEHLYSCDVIGDINVESISGYCHMQLLEIKRLCDKNQASYFRLI